jgi:hypothetical protein
MLIFVIINFKKLIMRNFINPNKIIEAYISEPYENSGEGWDMYPTHGWQAVIITGYAQDGCPTRCVIECENEKEAYSKLIKLGLIPIS